MSTVIILGEAEPELIAWKGRRALEEAQVVAFDEGVRPGLLALAPSDAERLPFSRESAIERARRGLRVVRITAGDCLAEAGALASAGIAFEIVPAPPPAPDFARLPLFGRRVVVTRAQGQADTLSSRLSALGAEAIQMPTIEIAPAVDYGPLDRAISELESYDWLIFTSANGVRFFMERLDLSTRDFRALRAKICAIGPATRAAVEALHLKVDLMGKEYVAEGLIEAFAAHELGSRRVLLPRAAVARDLVPVELARRGAKVDVVEAYCTVLPEGAPAQVREIFGAARKPDCITFTSSSTVRNFAGLAGTSPLRGVAVVSIGPVTTRTARELGIHVTAEANPFTIDGLLEAVLGVCDTGMTPPSTA